MSCRHGKESSVHEQGEVGLASHNVECHSVVHWLT